MISQELLFKHFRKEASAAEEASIREWIALDPANQLEYENIENLWKLTEEPASDFTPDVDAAWLKVKAKTGIETLHKEQSNINWYKSNWMKIAAAVFIAVNLTILAVFMMNREEKLITLKADNNQQIFYLPDSSKVTLNVSSVLTYSENYNEESRDVKLDGEGFFEVQKSQKPFKITSLRSTVEVLGTSFNVRSRKEEVSDELTVVTGKVRFSNKENQQAIVTAGYSSVITPGKTILTKRSENENSMAWKSQMLIFDNVTLDQVSQDLSKYFGVKIEVQNESLKQCRFTGSFEKPALNEVMEIISVSANVSVRRSADTIVLEGKGCN